jgi:hypothetical protein
MKTLIIMTFNIMSLSIKGLFVTISMKTLGTMTFDIMTLSIKAYL